VLEKVFPSLVSRFLKFQELDFLVYRTHYFLAFAPIRLGRHDGLPRSVTPHRGRQLLALTVSRTLSPR
jgi:hypothetical protein